MFENLKNKLDTMTMINEAEAVVSEHADVADDFLEGIDDKPLTSDEEAKLGKIIETIPEFEEEAEHLTSDDVKSASSEVHDPSIDDLLSDQ